MTEEQKERAEQFDADAEQPKPESYIYIEFTEQHAVDFKRFEIVGVSPYQLAAIAADLSARAEYAVQANLRAQANREMVQRAQAEAAAKKVLKPSDKLLRA
jgi:histidinol phosphatase-like enzyme